MMHDYLGVSPLPSSPPYQGDSVFVKLIGLAACQKSASLTPGLLEAEGGRSASLLSCLGNRACLATERWGVSLNYNSLMFGEGFKGVLAG